MLQTESMITIRKLKKKKMYITYHDLSICHCPTSSKIKTK